METATEQRELDEPPIESTADEIPAEAEEAAHHSDVANGGNVPARQDLVQAAPPRNTTALIAGASASERIQVAKEIATQLDDVIKEQGLRTRIGKKKVVKKDGREVWEDNFHIDIEAWQTLAAFLELAIVPVWTRRVIDPSTGEAERVRYTVQKLFYPRGTKGKDIKAGTAEIERVETADVDGYSWEARVEVYKDGALVAAGESMVSRTEEQWRDGDDHAVRSMAQTRAASRAIATAARWIVTLAGYSGAADTTPQPDGDENRSPALQAGSEELYAQAHDRLLWLLDGDVGLAERLEDHLKGQYDGIFPAVVLQAIYLVAGAVKSQRDKAAAAA